MSTVGMSYSSDKDRILSIQHRHKSVEECLIPRGDASSLSGIRGDDRIEALIVYRVISPSMFLLAPFKAHESDGVRKVLLTEAAMVAVDEQFPGLCPSLGIGSIIEARVRKSEECSPYFTHFVSRVLKIWDQPISHIRSTGNIVQVVVECDLSECKYGIEVGIPTKRLMNYLGEDLTMKGCTLECTSIIMEGGPTSFRILDTCKIIKKIVGKSDEIIPKSGMQYIAEDHSIKEED